MNTYVVIAIIALVLTAFAVFYYIVKYVDIYVLMISNSTVVKIFEVGDIAINRTCAVYLVGSTNVLDTGLQYIYKAVDEDLTGEVDTFKFSYIDIPVFTYSVHGTYMNTTLTSQYTTLPTEYLLQDLVNFIDSPYYAMSRDKITKFENFICLLKKVDLPGLDYLIHCSNYMFSRDYMLYKPFINGIHYKYLDHVPEKKLFKIHALNITHGTYLILLIHKPIQLPNVQYFIYIKFLNETRYYVEKCYKSATTRIVKTSSGVKSLVETTKSFKYECTSKICYFTLIEYPLLNVTNTNTTMKLTDYELKKDGVYNYITIEMFRSLLSNETYFLNMLIYVNNSLITHVQKPDHVSIYMGGEAGNFTVNATVVDKTKNITYTMVTRGSSGCKIYEVKFSELPMFEIEGNYALIMIPYVCREKNCKFMFQVNVVARVCFGKTCVNI